jgi:cupredoxin-like protein
MNPGRLIIAAAFAMTATVAIAQAEDVVTYELTLSNHAFSPVELKVPAGKPFKILLHNKDTTPAEFESKQLKIEKVVAGSADITVNVRALEPGKYEFVDEYHEDETKGHVVAE